MWNIGCELGWIFSGFKFEEKEDVVQAFGPQAPDIGTCLRSADPQGDWDAVYLRTLAWSEVKFREAIEI